MKVLRDESWGLVNKLMPTVVKAYQTTNNEYLDEINAIHVRILSEG